MQIKRPPVPDFPVRVRALRTRLGLSMEAFGHLVGVSLQTVCCWEHGRQPSPLALRAFEEVERQHPTGLHSNGRTSDDSAT